VEEQRGGKDQAGATRRYEGRFLAGLIDYLRMRSFTVEIDVNSLRYRESRHRECVVWLGRAKNE